MWDGARVTTAAASTTGQREKGPEPCSLAAGTHTVPGLHAVSRGPGCMSRLHGPLGT